VATLWSILLWMSKLEWHGFVTTWRRSKDLFFDDNFDGKWGTDYVAKKRIMYPWEKKFAWFPVTVHSKLKWLTTVYRKRYAVSGDQRNLPPMYEYGNLFDVIKDPV
jgi:hypothetical protein